MQNLGVPNAKIRILTSTRNSGLRVMLFGQHLHLGESIRLFSNIWNILCFTDFLLFLSPYIFTVMILCKHIYWQDRFSSIIYFWIQPIFFCFIDYTIRFTDLMLHVFLSPCIGYSHDTLQTQTYGQDRLVASSVFGFLRVFCFTGFIICFLDFDISRSLYSLGP